MFCSTAILTIDGDTIDVSGVRVRLHGIDAPEMNTAAGKSAARWLARYLKGKRLCCHAKAVDRYGRTVAICYDGKRDLAEVLVCAGHARDWPRYSKGRYASPECP